MASGSIALSSSKAWTGRIDWSSTSDIGGNYSDVYVKATMWKTDGQLSSSNSYTNGTITIDGAADGVTKANMVQLAFQKTFGVLFGTSAGNIIGGLGVIENDFHERTDLSPNICAVFTEEKHRRQGIAGHLLNMAVEDLKLAGISPVYLVTDHIGFYERYGWDFFCMVQCNDETDMSRMYVHK